MYLGTAFRRLVVVSRPPLNRTMSILLLNRYRPQRMFSRGEKKHRECSQNLYRAFREHSHTGHPYPGTVYVLPFCLRECVEFWDGDMGESVIAGVLCVFAAVSTAFPYAPTHPDPFPPLCLFKFAPVSLWVSCPKISHPRCDTGEQV